MSIPAIGLLIGMVFIAYGVRIILNFPIAPERPNTFRDAFGFVVIGLCIVVITNINYLGGQS